MDLETELSRVLHTRDIPVPVLDPVPAVHEGIRRRRRTQRLQVAASGLAVVVLALAATAVVNDRLAAHRNPPPTAVQPPAPDPAAVPDQFLAQDVSYSGPSTSWVLGSAKCPTGYCRYLLTSTDGSPWERRTPPDATLPGGDGMFDTDCAVATCVSHLRFVKTDHGDIGYAYGPGLAITLDGGRTWTNQAVTGQVLGLEATSHSVVRVVDPSGVCPVCDGFSVERSVPDGSQWLPVHTTKSFGMAGASLVRQGRRLLVLERGAQDTHSRLLISNDEGDTWVEREDPCGKKSGYGEVDASQVALAVNGRVIALCQQGDGSESSVRVSEDSGKSFHPAGALPGKGALLAAVDDAIVVVIDDDERKRHLVRSTDRGQHWTQVATQSSDPRYASEYLAFTNGGLGTWIGGDRRRLVRTADSGATWKDQPLNR